MENKCPCCGGEIVIMIHSACCDKCPFECAVNDLPRIAAAMELARAEAELNTSTRFLFENEAIDDDTPEFSEWITTHRVVMKQHMTAKDRVLEVFGGE